MTQSNINEIQKLEHDDVFDVKKVSQFVDDGSGNLIRQEEIATKDNQTNGDQLTQPVDSYGSPANSIITELLEQVLLELKIINVHQQSMTDEEVNEADVEKR